MQQEFILNLTHDAQVECLFFLLCTVNKDGTHHDVIRQLLWQSFEAVVQGFIVT